MKWIENIIAWFFLIMLLLLFILGIFAVVSQLIHSDLGALIATIFIALGFYQLLIHFRNESL